MALIQKLREIGKDSDLTVGQKHGRILELIRETPGWKELGHGRHKIAFKHIKGNYVYSFPRYTHVSKDLLDQYFTYRLAPAMVKPYLATTSLIWLGEIPVLRSEYISRADLISYLPASTIREDDLVRWLAGNGVVLPYSLLNADRDSKGLQCGLDKDGGIKFFDYSDIFWNREESKLYDRISTKAKSSLEIRAQKLKPLTPSSEDRIGSCDSCYTVPLVPHVVKERTKSGWIEIAKRSPALELVEQDDSTANIALNLNHVSW